MADIELVIKIPDKNFHEILNGFLSNESKRKLRDAIKNGIALPDNATNGDVIKALFPLIEVKREISSTSDNMVVRDASFLGAINRFHTDWWNAPYKGGQEE